MQSEHSGTRQAGHCWWLENKDPYPAPIGKQQCYIRYGSCIDTETLMIQLCISYGKEMRDGPKPDGSFLGNSKNLHHPYNILGKSIREQKSLKGLLMNSEMKTSFCPQNRSSLVYKYLHSQIFNNQKNV